MKFVLLQNVGVSGRKLHLRYTASLERDASSPSTFSLSPSYRKGTHAGFSLLPPWRSSTMFEVEGTSSANLPPFPRLDFLKKMFGDLEDAKKVLEFLRSKNVDAFYPHRTMYFISPRAMYFLYLWQLLNVLYNSGGYLFDILDLESESERILDCVNMLRDYQFGGRWLDFFENRVRDAVEVYLL